MTTFKHFQEKEDDEASFEERRPPDHFAFHKTAGKEKNKKHNGPGIGEDNYLC